MVKSIRLFYATLMEIYVEGCVETCVVLYTYQMGILGLKIKKIKNIFKNKNLLKLKFFTFFDGFFPLPLPIPWMTVPRGRGRNFSGCSNLPTISEAPSRAERVSQVESLSSYFWPFFGPSRQTPPQETRNWSSCWPLPVLFARIFLTKYSP